MKANKSSYLRNGARYDQITINHFNSYMRFQLVPKSLTLNDLELV